MTGPKLAVLSTLAVMGALQDLLPDYQAHAGVVIEAEFAPTTALQARIAAGARGGLAILTDEAVDGLLAEEVLAGRRVDLARSFIGVAVRAGARAPDIETPAAFRQALLDAGSVVYSAGGASGLFFARLIGQLGIADAVRAKATVIPSGLTGEKVACGEAELAVQQVSELMAVPGLDIVGRLPAALHAGAVFSGARFAGAGRPAAALLDHLSGAEAAAMLRRHGLEPVYG